MTFGGEYFGESAFGGTDVLGTILSVEGTVEFLAADAIEQFQVSGNQIRFRYERLDYANNSLGFMDNLVQVGGTIGYDYSAVIKRTGSLVMLDVTDPAVFDFSSDRIRPWMGVLMPDGTFFDFALGVFLVSTPTRHADRGVVTRPCTLYDQAQVLVSTVLTNISLYGGYYLPAGTIYTDAIVSLLNSCGITNINVVPSDAVMPSDRTWKQANPKITSQQINDSTVWAEGANVATIISDLLMAVNYGSLWFDGMGQAQVLPYVRADLDSVDHVYSTNDISIINPVIDQTLDLFSVPNVIVLAVSQPDRPLLVSQFVNSDPNSAVSTVSRKRRITYFDNNADAADQATLDALCYQKAVDFANVYEIIDWSSLPMPNHGDRDIIQFTHDTLGVSAAYSEILWSLTLAPGGQMTHSIHRIVNIDASLHGDPDDDGS